jgi:ABC-type dipeptide/oligopeptide/nickel transport system permease component
LPAFWSVLTPVFLLIHIVPGDPVESMLGEGAARGKVAQLRHALGLDLPLAVQYRHLAARFSRTHRLRRRRYSLATGAARRLTALSQGVLLE